MKNWIYFENGGVDLNEVVGFNTSRLNSDGLNKAAISFVFGVDKDITIPFMSVDVRDRELELVKSQLKNTKS